MKLPALLVLLFLLPGPASGAATAGPVALPSWFTETLLDFRDDVAQAARDGKRLMVLFEQNGCPYCKELILTNFSQKAIADIGEHIMKLDPFGRLNDKFIVQHK